MYKISKRKTILFIVLLFAVTILASTLTAYFVTRTQSNIHFVSQQREDNPEYGYLEINSKEYYQLYTTTQVDIGNGLHYHRIDLRSSVPQQ